MFIVKKKLIIYTICIVYSLLQVTEAAGMSSLSSQKIFGSVKISLNNPLKQVAFVSQSFKIVLMERLVFQNLETMVTVGRFDMCIKKKTSH